MPRLFNPVGMAATALKTTVNRRVVQRVVDKSSEYQCDEEFMRFIATLPKSSKDRQNLHRTEMLQKAEDDLDACLKKNAAEGNHNLVSQKMLQFSDIATTKKRRGRNNIGRGRWNLSRVY